MLYSIVIKNLQKLSTTKRKNYFERAKSLQKKCWELPPKCPLNNEKSDAIKKALTYSRAGVLTD